MTTEVVLLTLANIENVKQTSFKTFLTYVCKSLKASPILEPGCIQYPLLRPLAATILAQGQLK